jgi:hypothetical protein
MEVRFVQDLSEWCPQALKARTFCSISLTKAFTSVWSLSGHDWLCSRLARGELEDAIVRFLAFASEYQEFAQRIAKETALRAAVVGSGRVGRTRQLTLEERAALSARAYIRHSFTSYHDDLDTLPLEHRSA